jgi:hypothetical protein
MADLAAYPVTNRVHERNTHSAARPVRELIADGITSGAFRDVHGAFVADSVAATMRRIRSRAVLPDVGMRDADAYGELALLILNCIRS